MLLVSPAGHTTMKNKGFTLIELLLVIAILGLMSSIMVVLLGPTRQRGRDTKRLVDLGQIHSAMELCYIDKDCTAEDAYPDTTAGANTLTRIDPDGTPLLLDLNRVKDPKDQAPYQYTWIDGTDQYYCVHAKLEAKSDTWFCASSKGTKQKTAAAYTPNKDDCCGYDVDN